MKIACILTTFPCRSETFAAREIEGLRLLGFDITVLAAVGERSDAGCAHNVKIYYRPCLFSAKAVGSIAWLCIRYPMALFRLLGLILKLARACPAEAVSLTANIHTIGFFAGCLNKHGIRHIHAYFLSWPGIIGLALSVATGRALSISAHARDIFVEAGAVELKIWRSKFIRTCTQQGAEELKNNLPAKYNYKLHLVYHGLRMACERPFRNSKLANRDTILLVAAGRLIAKKGFAELLRAFALVVREKPNCTLVIAGDGPERKRLKDLIKQLTLEKYVKLPGWLSQDATLRLIQRASLLVAPSIITKDGDRDGLPNVILEAFAAGVPVIASNLKAIAEAVKHRQTGLLIKAGDVTVLAAAIKELLQDKALQSRLSRRAYEMAIRRFEATKNIRQLAKLFTKTK